MSDDGERTDNAGGFGGDNAEPPPHEPTAAYGAPGAPPAADAQPPGADATSIYGAAPGAASPQWATPGQEGPQHTAVQPIPGQQPQQPAQAAPQQYYPQQQYTPQPQGSPPTQVNQQAQPAPAQPWQHATPSGYGAPQAQPAPSSVGGARRWNLWAGIAAATAISALGGAWRLAKIITDIGDYPFRLQMSIALGAALVVLGLLTLLGLAAKKRGPAAVMTLLLGGTLLVDALYGWYLQIDGRFGGFELDFLFDVLVPASLPALLLGMATLVAALLMRLDDGRQR